MIDNARSMLEEGRHIASERIAGVNDNLHISHYHEFYEIYYLESGERYHLIEDQLYHLTPGQFIIFKPYMLHRSYGDKDMPFCRLLIYFRSGALLSPKLDAVMQAASGAYQLSAQDNTIFYQCMNRILLEQKSPQQFHAEYLSSLLNTMLIHLLRSKKDPVEQNKKNRVTKVISYLSKHYAESMSLQELSRQFYVSPYHLCREFKLYANVTIIQYLNAVRIIEAQKMLLSTKKSITQISSEVGFDSITHFERVFKKITGSTPRAARKINL
jgi:AraC-like DNA-binding protein